MIFTNNTSNSTILPYTIYITLNLIGKGRSTVAALNHNLLAITHKNTKLDLPEGELKYFHRPRLTATRRMSPWSITLKDISKRYLYDMMSCFFMY